MIIALTQAAVGGGGNGGVDLIFQGLLLMMVTAGGAAFLGSRPPETAEWPKVLAVATVVLLGLGALVVIIGVVVMTQSGG